MGKIIRQFREILFWPLEIPELTSARSKSPEDSRKHFDKALTGQTPWSKCDRTVDVDYAERVYFHPFVQRFLYGGEVSGRDNTPTGTCASSSAEKQSDPINAFKRTDIEFARVVLPGKPGTVELKVESLVLYLFAQGVAILTCEVSASNITLAQAQEILDRFRRAYPPYWETQDQAPGHCPLLVQWLRKGEVVARSDYDNKESFHAFASQHNAPRPASHWQYLLQPLQAAGTDGADFSYRQLEDERMPFMAWLALDNPADLSRGDFVRLCFADGSGESDTPPYARAFLQDFEQTYCYDRYWDHVKNDPDPTSRSAWMNTRYLLCGYGFVMVGKDGPGFFTDGKNGALAHFHRHYFKMGLIAHYHRAALLSVSDALSQAVAECDTKSEEFRQRIGGILQGLLDFTHRYWFREVSNQVQARELFSRWILHLDTAALFEQVKQEAQDANAFLDMRQQQKQTDTTVRLTVVATVGLSAGLVGTYLAIPWKELRNWGFIPDVFWNNWEMIVVALVFLGTAIAVWQSKRLAKILEWLAGKGS